MESLVYSLTSTWTTCLKSETLLTRSKTQQTHHVANARKGKATGYCRECGECLCNDCQAAHNKWEALKSHHIVSLQEVQAQATNLLPPKEKVSYCPKHPKKKLKIYCETCSELICNDCTIRLHQGHNYDLVADVFPKHKEEIASSLKPVRRNLHTVKQALKAFERKGKGDQRPASHY